MNKSKLKLIAFFLFFFFFPFKKIDAKDLEVGKKLFFSNCNVCHLSGRNIILPEKDLKKENLYINGMNTLDSISYQIMNGKNGMPAFGGRLKEKEIEEIANYILESAF
jgi:cytochrome c6